MAYFRMLRPYRFATLCLDITLPWAKGGAIAMVEAADSPRRMQNEVIKKLVRP